MLWIKYTSWHCGHQNVRNTGSVLTQRDSGWNFIFPKRAAEAGKWKKASKNHFIIKKIIIKRADTHTRLWKFIQTLFMHLYSRVFT